MKAGSRAAQKYKQDAPLDLSNAKAQVFGWRGFEVKYPEYTLFPAGTLAHRSASERHRAPMGLQPSCLAASLADLIANCASCA